MAQEPGDQYIGDHIPDGVVPEPGGQYPSDPDNGYGGGDSTGEGSPAKYPSDDPGFDCECPVGGCPDGRECGLVFESYCVEAATGGEWSAWYSDPDYVPDPTKYDSVKHCLAQNFSSA